MISEVALISGEAIGAVENSEKIRQQVDQHSTRSREDLRGAFGRGMIVIQQNVNKSAVALFFDGTIFPFPSARS